MKQHVEDLQPLQDQLPELMRKIQNLQAERKDIAKFKDMEEVLKKERLELENLQKQVKVRMEKSKFIII